MRTKEIINQTNKVEKLRLKSIESSENYKKQLILLIKMKQVEWNRVKNIEK